jgi:hypothetical protein
MKRSFVGVPPSPWLLPTTSEEVPRFGPQLADYLRCIFAPRSGQILSIIILVCFFALCAASQLVLSSSTHLNEAGAMARAVSYAAHLLPKDKTALYSWVGTPSCRPCWVLWYCNDVRLRRGSPMIHFPSGSFTPRSTVLVCL